MKTLHDLGMLYGTDKAHRHNYCHFYDKHLTPYRDRHLKILEIGVKNGSSLKMWRDYFHNSNIYGIDVNPKSIFQSERIQTFIQDQGDVEGLTNFVEQHGPFDIVIDDGSHNTDHLDISFKLFKDCPIFIWEDICVCNFNFFDYRKHDKGPNSDGKYPLEISKELAENKNNCFIFDNNGTGKSITFLINNIEEV